MDKKLRERLKKLKINRAAVLIILFAVLAFVLLRRIYVLQIINGEDYRTNFSLQTTKTRTIASTRGKIYDRNGKILASNQLSYSLTLEDAGSYGSTREQYLNLNGEAYRIANILESNGDSLDNDFHIVLDENGNYVFNVSGTSLLRFKADVYGRALIKDLTTQESETTADEMMAHLISERGYGIIRTKNPYTEEELASVGLPPVETLTPKEILDITYVRYQLFTTSYRKYVPVTIATDISDESVAELSEKKNTLTGIDIVEDSIRVYDQAEAFASLIGYTGKISAEELSELSEINSNYDSTYIVGKSGIEKIFETTLQGSDGQETVHVDNFGRVLGVDEDKRISPSAGGDVYLTIDKDLQIATYKMLEQRIAGVLETVIIEDEYFDKSEVDDTEDIRIPITDIYIAIFENSVLDVSHFTEDDATATEQALQAAFTDKQQKVFAAIAEQLTGSDPLPYKELSDELKEYESYIVNDLLMGTSGILNSSKIDKTDETYLAWTRDESISLQQYLTYAASMNWIDISAFASSDTYLDSGEIYAELSAYIEDYLTDDDVFGDILYKYLILTRDISGNQIIQALYDQGVLDKNNEDYKKWRSGAYTSYEMIKLKIHNLELTPAMLALDPCSGSAVVTDPTTGEILACVTYPGYDNNRLANSMDVAYYNKLAADASRPFYNKATQQKTAPGSTFKLVTTTAGLEENTIDRNTVFGCNGIFDLTDTPLNCWYEDGHGDQNIIGGLQNSCNVFFANVAYTLGINEEGNWSDSLSLSKLISYAKMYALDKNSGIEVPEATPSISDRYAIQSAIGQGTHSYTTTQLARYVTTIANSGTIYNISMVDKITDTDGNILEDYTPEIEGTVTISDETWDIIHDGMRHVVMSKQELKDLDQKLSSAGKTGTAQESKSRPSHALYICYAPYEDPEVAIAVRIGNGYSSTNAELTAKDILQYYFSLVDQSLLITGKARTDSVTQRQVD